MNKIIKIFFNLLVVIVLVSCKPEPIVVTSIEITSPALKTEYCINEPLDTTGLEVTASMENGKREIVTNWTTEFDNTIEGDSIPVIIKYAGTEASYIVSIDKHIWKNGEIVCQKCKNAYDLYETPVDSETGADATSTSKYIYFGVFPKTVLPETSSVTVDETDSVIMGANTYYKGNDGNYYAKVTAKIWKWDELYPDFKYTDGSIKTTGAVRYFKVEPIKWKVLTPDYDGKNNALILAEDILTANVPYYDRYENRIIDGKTVVGSNYQHSQIRAYLNGLTYQSNKSYGECKEVVKWNGNGFLQTAFTTTAQAKIATTMVDNSADSANGTDVKRVSERDCCDSTEDKIFLLSRKEVTTTAYGFAEDSNRICLPTDYALANYCCDYRDIGDNDSGGKWWLRSPDISGGWVQDVQPSGYVRYNDVYVESIGIRPALSISLY